MSGWARGFLWCISLLPSVHVDVLVLFPLESAGAGPGEAAALPLSRCPQAQ